jgi:16S rRNA processing protein RimM
LIPVDKPLVGALPASGSLPGSTSAQPSSGEAPRQALTVKQAPPDGLLELGRVVSAYGLKGWLKIQPSSAESVLPKVKTWWLECPPGHFVCHTIKHAKMHGVSVVAQPEGMDDRTPAEALKGARVWVSRADFPKAPKDEYYWADLIGCEVLDPDGAVLGKVLGLQDHGAHPILEVRGPDESREPLLIPFVASIILEVLMPQRSIRVDWRADYME